MENEKICCICGMKFIGWGNNPWPVVKDENATCCNDCNAMFVIPARMAQMEMSQKFKED